MSDLTLYPHDSAQTDKTDETYSVSITEFLEALFRQKDPHHCPIVVSFSGNPGQMESGSWQGVPWDDKNGESPKLQADNNNYFSLAVFRPDEAGRYRRRKTSFVALHAIMLDDLGGKVPMERMTLAPSWLLETSPGNYQAGFILAEPLGDGLLADKLVQAVVTAGLCDPGASGPRTRLARLPSGHNGKHTPPFSCQLRIWEPERRYSPEEIALGLQFDMAGGKRRSREGGGTVTETLVDGDTIWIPRPEDNIVVRTLRDRGLYKVPLGEGKHDITCPWVDEHTDHIDSGTAYFEPDDLWPIGGFKCFHGHCQQRSIRDLLTFLGIESSAARMKATIRIVGGEIHRIADVAERELSQTMHYFQRGNLIATVVNDPGTRETSIQNITMPALVRALSGVATWERYDKRMKEWQRVDPPERHARLLIDSTRYSYLPVLQGLARQPYLRTDGTLMTVAGYDAAGMMFGVFDARHFHIPETPTRENAEQALLLLKALLSEFPFACETDLAGALSAILTATIRASLAHAPMFHVRAHMVGSGKSYLCELVTAFATPQQGTPTTFPTDDEECRKLLLAELLRAPAVIEFDNLTTDLLAHKSLCTALTSEYMSGRILGVSKTATVNTRVLFLSSGNNVGPVQDMVRRCITIRLDPSCETPAARNFSRPDLVHEVLRERGRYVAAAMTIVRAYIVAGRPNRECKALAGFGEWSDLCRQPLLWLGCADPVASLFTAISEDPHSETLGRLLRAWQEVFGKRPAMVREAKKKVEEFAEQYIDLRETMHDIAGERGEVNSRKMGRWLTRNAGRIVDGCRFVRAPGNRSAEAWQVESVLPVLSVSPPAPIETVKEDISLPKISKEQTSARRQRSLFEVPA